MLGWHIKIAKIAGDSMSPAFRNEDFILALSLPWRRFHKGQVVLVKHSTYQLIVKRIACVKHDKILLKGDNLCSLSSAAMGWIKQGDIVGHVIFHLPATKSRAQL